MGFNPNCEGPRLGEGGANVAGSTVLCGCQVSSTQAKVSFTSRGTGTHEHIKRMSTSNRRTTAAATPGRAPPTHPDREAARALAHRVLVRLPLVGATLQAHRLASSAAGSALACSWCPPRLLTQNRGAGQGRGSEAWGSRWGKTMPTEHRVR